MQSDLRSKYERLFTLVGSNFSPQSEQMIEQALSVAEQKLAGVARYDSTPMLNHGVRTAEIVISEIGLGRNSTISTIMHDVVRLGLMSAEQVGELFGEQCVGIIKGLCNISEVNTKVSPDQANNFRDLIISYSTDPRVILIKLADRLEVMRSLEMFPPEKRIKKSWESLNLYSQIAHKLGLYTIKSELEDVSLSYLEPQMYKHIIKKLEDSARQRDIFTKEFIIPIEQKLQSAGIKYHLKSRTKSIYSIWDKMRKMGINFEEIFDIFALRIIVDCPRELEKQVCWNIYSIVTDFYTPNPDRMRDWISIPKSNGYESLHTTVVTKDGHWVEIQIRSERMNEVAERGIAAHWRYKGVNQSGMGSEQWLGKLRELMESTDTSLLAERFDSKLSSGEIFVFTPNGDLRKLPEGATVLDFAFDIHTNLGSTCTGGRINRRNVPIKEVLKNGDIVEILTSKNQKPKADWLNFVSTSKARNKIKSYMREEQAKTASLGREELERKIKNWKFTLTIDDAVTLLCKFYKLRTGVELYGRIASEKIEMSEIKEVITRSLSGEMPEIKTRTTNTSTKATAQSSDALIIDEMSSSMKYKFGKCCNPIFGDDVFGFITIGTGITIHRNDCPNAPRLKQMYDYRILPARWRSATMGGSFRASIMIVAEDTAGVVNRITEIINRDLKINIRSMNFSSDAGAVSGTIDIEVTSTQVVDTVIHSILRIKSVQKAYRINS